MSIWFRPSGAPGWMKCGARIKTSVSRPEVDGDAAREGQCAAWAAECVINGDADSAEDLLGRTHSESGWMVDADMVRHVQWYIDIVTKRAGSHQAEYFVQHPELPVGGTIDHIGWSEDFSTLYVDDLKYGYKIIEPRTWQIACYMWLVLSNMPYERWPRLIQLSILQPRAIHKNGPYRKLVIGMEEAHALCQQLQQRVVDIMNDPAPPAVPGSQCYECHAAHKCTALTQSVYGMWDVVQSREFHDPTPQQLSEELVMIERMTELFDARKSAVEAEAVARIEEASFIPGWQLEKRFGKKKFTVDDTSIEMITGVDPTETKTCTPAELIRRGANKDVVETITRTPFIGVKLSRFDQEDADAHMAKAQGRNTA